MDQQHHHSCQEGTKESLLHKVYEEIWHATLSTLQILLLHHREHPDQLYHSLVRELRGSRLQGPPVGGEDSPVHHWDRAPTHPGQLLRSSA